MSQYELSSELKKSIPWKLIIVFLFFSVAIILVGISFYKSQRDSVFKDYQNSLTAIASLKIGQIEKWHNERLGDALVISQNEPLINCIQQYFANENQPEIKRELSKWMESIYTEYDYSGVLLVDTLFKVRLSVASADTIAGDSIRKELESVRKNHTIIMTDLHKANCVSYAHLDLIIPLVNYNGKNPVLIGIAILRIDPLKYLFPLIQSWPTPNKSAETLIVRKEGDSILYLNELRHWQNASLNLKAPVSNGDLLGAKVVRGTNGVVEGVDYRNIPVVGYLTGIPGFDWFMVAKIDKEEIQAPLKSYLIITIGGIVLLILVNASLFGYWIWNQSAKLYRLQVKGAAALRESEEKFNTAFHMSPVTVTISNLDDNKFLDVNNTFLTDMGYTREETIGRTGIELEIWADENERLWVINELKEKGKIFGKTISYRTKAGKILYGLTSMSVFLVNDKPCNISTVINITESVRLSRQIEEERNKLSSLIKSIPDEIWYADMNKKFTLINPSGLREFGVSGTDKHDVEEFAKSLEVFRPDGTPRPVEEAPPLRALAGEVVMNIEEMILIPDKKELRYRQVNAAPVRDISNKIIGAISVVRDITDLKNAESKILKLNQELELRVIERTGQLELSNKELEAFAYSVSHDLRSPLRAIHSFSNILLEEFDKQLDEEGKRICRIISSNAKKMGELIDDLLSFSRIGRTSLNSCILDMRSIVSSVIEDQVTKTDITKIKMEKGKFHNSFGDGNLIRLVWTNLISNAIKYSSKKSNPEVVIGSILKDGIVSYYVRDNGVGFDMKFVDKLFGVFQRLHSEKEFEGNGVGLAIVQRIISKHGGKVWAEGEDGAGATFYFSLPANGEDMRQTTHDSQQTIPDSRA